MKTLAPLESIRLCILLALAAGPTYGYALQARIDEDADDRIHIDHSTIYKTLKRLEEDGDIKRSASKNDSRQHVYALTPRGRRTLKLEADRLGRAVQLIGERFK
jgi:DNA-binding PadR family transcriptional regulator